MEGDVLAAPVLIPVLGQVTGHGGRGIANGRLALLSDRFDVLKAREPWKTCSVASSDPNRLARRPMFTSLASVGRYQ
jgi:hypothetical protein